MGLHVGDSFGDYSVIAIIGAGSMGNVFQVQHRLTQRKEAVKVLSAELATDTQIQRFEREIAVQARLKHPNIATVHNAIRLDGRLILVMEFLEGRTLENLLRQGSLQVASGVQYIRQTLSALGYAHRQGVVHRDVNPANLIITSDGVVKLTDFGVSKSFGDLQLTNFGDPVGCLDYMAPEQARGSANPDPRSDLYSVCVILYEILTGRKPFGDKRSLGKLISESEAEPVPPTAIKTWLWSGWNDIIRTGLARDRTKRYQSADEFLQALKHAEAATFFGRSKNRLKTALGMGLAAAAFAAVAVPSISFRVPSLPAKTFHIPPPEISSVDSGKADVVLRPPGPQTRYHSLTAVRKVNPSAASARAPRTESTPDEQPSPAPKKKRFWSKLNPFRKGTDAAP